MMGTYEVATARCWVEVDLDALGANARSAASILRADGRTDRLLIPVLKGNAYGLGAVPVARHLNALGLGLFAVATVGEGLELKRALPDVDVLVMGLAQPAEQQSAVQAGLILTLISARQAESLSAEAARMGLRARVHIKLNTGLNRLGFDVADGIGPIMTAAARPGLDVEGIFTHLALHDEASDREQLRALNEISAALSIPFAHALDSIGMVRYPDALLGGVRAGAWLYGVCPKGYAHPDACLPVLSFKARVSQIRDLPKGAHIGYDDDHPLPRAARIATLSAGYADGCPRLSNAGAVEIHGKRAPIRGLTCMDQMMADVSAIPEAREGDIATLLGGSITIDEYADWANTNRNDTLSRISRRVPRVYLRDRRPAMIADYFCGCNEVNL